MANTDLDESELNLKIIDAIIAKDWQCVWFDRDPDKMKCYRVALYNGKRYETFPVPKMGENALLIKTSEPLLGKVIDLVP